MKEYKIKQTFPTLWFLTLLFTIFLGIAIAIICTVTKIFINSGFFGFSLTLIPFVILGFILPRYTATGYLQILFDESGIIITQISKSIFVRNSKKTINWLDINEYLFQANKQFDKFKIVFNDSSKFIFFHNNDYNNQDDFLNYLADFEIKIKNINSAYKLKKDIIRSKTFYETKWGILLAGFAIILMIGIPIILHVFNSGKHPNYSGIALVYIGAIFYLIQVLVNRTKN